MKITINKKFRKQDEELKWEERKVLSNQKKNLELLRGNQEKHLQVMEEELLKEDKLNSRHLIVSV